MGSKKGKRAGKKNTTVPNPSTEKNSSEPAAEESVHNGASSSTSSRTPSPSPMQEVDHAAHAEQLKVEGNNAFKAGLYGLAIDKYSEAIEAQPTEPTFLTNRAASYMALKRYKPALADCQLAANLQSSSPSPKTLVRLARCHVALGSPQPALSVLRQALAVEPKNVSALQLQAKAVELESHLRNFHTAKAAKNWAVARLALDKCVQALEGGETDAPPEWKCWRIESEIGRGNWNAAIEAANNALRLDSNSADIMALRGLVLFLTAKLPGALQHALSALRLDPDNARAKSLRQRVKAVEKLKEEGNGFFKQEKWQEAIDKYSEAMKVVGESDEEGKGGQMRATLLSNRATSLLKLNRHDEALADTDLSIELYPASFKAYRTRARINMHLEKYESAVGDFKQALEQASMEGLSQDERSIKTELTKAEAALKRSKTKDYYKILGVSRDCLDSEIKKAYRRESLIHHPDKGGDEEKFKLVVEAHSVLSDPRRRERYDMGVDEDGSMGSSGMGGGFGGMDPNDIANIFMQFGGGMRSSGFSFGGGGGGGSTHFHY